jgi:hypothetical protein
MRSGSIGLQCARLNSRQWAIESQGISTVCFGNQGGKSFLYHNDCKMDSIFNRWRRFRADGHDRHKDTVGAKNHTGAPLNPLLLQGHCWVCIWYSHENDRSQPLLSFDHRNALSLRNEHTYESHVTSLTRPFLRFPTNCLPLSYLPPKYVNSLRSPPPTLSGVPQADFSSSSI